MIDLDEFSETELAELREAISLELERRQILADAPSQIDNLAAQFRAAAGILDGSPYRPPTGSHDAVEPHGRRTFNGRLWENVSGGYLAHSPAEYPEGWADRGPAEDGGDLPPLEAEPWAPNTDYAAGKLVSEDDAVFVCIQGHRSLVGWNPAAVPALWRRV